VGKGGNRVSFGLKFDFCTYHKGCEYISKLLGCRVRDGRQKKEKKREKEE
jgi:hypothetical protein